jgi:hypothetical protein
MAAQARPGHPFGVLLNALGHGVTPQEPIDESSLGGFEHDRRPPPQVMRPRGSASSKMCA